MSRDMYRMKRYIQTLHVSNETLNQTLHVTKHNVKFSSRDERNVNVTLNFRMERERNVKIYKRAA